MARMHGNSMLLGPPKCRKFGTIPTQQPCVVPQQEWHGERSFLTEDRPRRLNQVWRLVFADFYDKNMMKILRSTYV